MKIFWSWQSDRSAKWCRDVVEEALARALRELGDEFELEANERPELDHDTLDAKGMAAIADTIFEKIRSAAVFVGDVTTVGRSDGGGRELPNPNVLIELGWAWAHLSHEKIVLVANRHFGPKSHERLPFDIRHRRAVVFYSLAKDAALEVVEDATAGLAADLRDALRTCLADWLAERAASPGPEGRPSRDGDPSVWFPADALLRHQPFHGGGGMQHARPLEGRRLYARIVPESFREGVPRALRVHGYQGPNGNSGLRPLGPWTNGDGGVNGDGALRYALAKAGDPADTWSATQWFRDTGELWSFDTERLSGARFHFAMLVNETARFLSLGLGMLVDLGATGGIRIELGAVGLLGTQWPGQFEHERADALLDHVRVSQNRRKWDEPAVLAILVEYGEALSDAYGRPAYGEDAIARMIVGG